MSRRLATLCGEEDEGGGVSFRGKLGEKRSSAIMNNNYNAEK